MNTLDYTGYGSVFLFIAFAAIFIAITFNLSKLLRPKGEKTSGKMTAYECGEDPIGDPWAKFNIRFYIVALIFVVFDVEIIFLYPWAVAFRDLGMFAFVEMFIFIFILLLGLAFVWRKGDLEWVKPKPRYTKADIKQAES